MGAPTTSRIVVAGSSGVIGSALVASLRATDHAVVRLVRREPVGPDEYRWDPAGGQLDPGVLAGADAIVNLCGVGVGDKRWSGAYKQQIYDSRVVPTEVLATAAASAGVPVLVNASAVGYYGDTGDRVVDETGPSGSGFLAHVCTDWEGATEAASVAGVRVVLVRTGLVLSPAGGLLGRTRPLFALGLGARLGDGRWYMPWISLQDEVRALEFVMTQPPIRGPVNLTGPAPVTNAEFTAAMGRSLGRPTPLVAPQFALRALLGEFADAEMTRSMRVIPAVLEQHGFEFDHHTIGEALAYANRNRLMK